MLPRNAFYIKVGFIAEMRPKPHVRSRSRPPWDENRIAALKRVVSSLVNLSSRDLVIVEGSRDSSSLRRLGVRAKIIAAGSTKRVMGLEDDGLLRARDIKIVFLPDFDREGREKIRKWRSELSSGRDVDSTTWRILRSLLKSEGIGIESLARLAEKLNLLRKEMWLGPDERVS